MRIMTKFRDSENTLLDRKIRDCMKEMSKKIKEVEENIKFISYEQLENFKEQASKKIKLFR
jgi:hypothetical protein